MTEEQNPPSDLPSSREKGEESYDPEQSPLTKKKDPVPKEPDVLPPTRQPGQDIVSKNLNISIDKILLNTDQADEGKFRRKVQSA